MEQLKTLNDMDITCADEDYDWHKREIPKQFVDVNKDELKQEAIKWIKAIERCNSDRKFKELFGLNLSEEWHEYIYGDELLIEFIKNRFNITDEQLKILNGKVE